MSRTFTRAFTLLLLGFAAFVVASMAFAATRRRDPIPQDPASDEVDLVASFGPLDFRSTASAFRGGSVTTWFGGGLVDLRDATLDPAGATLRTSSLFGGGSLVVPEAWNVETRVVGIGGVGDARSKADRPADAPTLRLEGVAIFGGWGITSQPPSEVGGARATR
jgi:hypothetical protein